MGLLRVLLAVCVYCSHTHRLGGVPWLDAGLAVELFFVISGFYMQLVLATKYNRATYGKNWPRHFYKARYLRLLPTYLMACALVLGAVLFQSHSSLIENWHHLLALPGTTGNWIFNTYLCFTNATMLFQDMTMFFAAHNGSIHWSAMFWSSDILLWKGLIVPQAWSLGVELNFYLVAPCILNLRTRWLVCLLCVSLVLKLTILNVYHLGDPWTYRFFPFELGYFLLGSLAFRCRTALERIMPTSIGRYCVYFMAAVLSVSVAGHYETIIYPVALTLMLPWMFRVTSRIKIDRFIGELSYPFYLFHLLSISVVGILSRRWLSMSEAQEAWGGLAFTLCLAALAVVLEMRFIEPWRTSPPEVQSEVVTSESR